VARPIPPAGPPSPTISRLAEANDEWISAERRYLSLDALNLTRRLIDPTAPEVVDVAA
jgi:hypothetical protein